VLRAIAPALTASVAMGAALLALYHPLHTRLDSPVLFLGIMMLLGTALYAALLLVFARGFVARELGDLRRLVTGAGPLTGAEA
jgi:hypothetical protein